MRRAAPALLLAGLLVVPRAARAERDLEATQSAGWYAGHIGLTVGLLGTSLGVQLVGAADTQPRVTGGLGFEQSFEGYFSPVPSRLSDITLFTSLVAPLGVLGATESSTRFANSLVIYSESLSFSLALNTVTKHLVRRARPYTIHPSREAQRWEAQAGVDRVLSFYSGHSSLSFTSATTGGLLFAAGEEARGARIAYWASGFTLAAFTAHARVRAGMHYPTDVLVGALVGAGLGLAVPLAHEVPIELRPEEGVAIAGGVVLGAALGFLLPRDTSEVLEDKTFLIDPQPGGAVFTVMGRLD